MCVDYWLIQQVDSSNLSSNLFTEIEGGHVYSVQVEPEDGPWCHVRMWLRPSSDETCRNAPIPIVFLPPISVYPAGVRSCHYYPPVWRNWTRDLKVYIGHLLF